MSKETDTQEPELPSSFKTRLYKIKHSEGQSEQNKFRSIRKRFGEVAGWGEIDFAQIESDGSTDLDVMTWDKESLWLPVSRRGAGAEQLLVIIAEVLMRGARVVGIEELESNLDEFNQKRLYDLLETLVGNGFGHVGQIVATAHSYFYSHELDNHEKLFVEKGANGRTKVKPWSTAAHDALFKPGDYRGERRRRRSR